jgi:hypothetical protein
MKTYKNFTEYLEEKFFDEYPMTLDDDIPDEFDSWLTCLDLDQIIIYSNEFAKAKVLEQVELSKQAI